MTNSRASRRTAGTSFPSRTATDVDAIDAALIAAKADPRPSFVAVRTVIGHGRARRRGHVEGTRIAARREQVIAEAKARIGWTWPPFTVPDGVREECDTLAKAGHRQHAAWRSDFARFAADCTRSLPRSFCARGTASSRSTSRRSSPRPSRVALEPPDSRHRTAWSRCRICSPELVGGSADLAGSTGTSTGGALVTRRDYSGSTIAFGIREFAMAAVLNGSRAARRIPALRQHIPRLQRLSAAGPAARRADEATGDPHPDPRLGCCRRGRPDPPTGRARRVAAADPGPPGAAAGRRSRNRRGLAPRHRAHRRSYGAGPHATGVALTWPLEPTGPGMSRSSQPAPRSTRDRGRCTAAGPVASRPGWSRRWTGRLHAGSDAPPRQHRGRRHVGLASAWSTWRSGSTVRCLRSRRRTSSPTRADPRGSITERILALARDAGDLTCPTRSLRMFRSEPPGPRTPGDAGDRRRLGGRQDHPDQGTRRGSGRRAVHVDLCR